MVVLVAAVALAAAGCGSGTKDFRTTAQQACADARAHGGTSVAAVAAANGRAVDTLRGLDAPKGRDDDVRTLVAGLGQQQRALAGLRDGLAHHAAPARLRELTGAADTQASLVAPAARRLGAPACGTTPAAVVARLETEDYTVQMLRDMGRLDHLIATLPHVRASQSRDALAAAGQRGFDQFNPITDHLQELDPPPGLGRLHERISNGLLDTALAYSSIGQEASSTGIAPRVAVHKASAQRGLDRARTAWRELRARLPRVPASGSPWGSTTAGVSAQDAHDQYLAALGTELDGPYFRPPANPKSWRSWAKLATSVRGQRARIAALHAPPDALAAHRLLLAGLRAVIAQRTEAAATLRDRSPAAYRRMRAAAVTAGRDLRAAQGRYDAAHYDVAINTTASGDGKAPDGSTP
jgi:hypothetical protein